MMLQLPGSRPLTASGLCWAGQLPWALTALPLLQRTWHSSLEAAQPAATQLVQAALTAAQGPGMAVSTVLAEAAQAQAADLPAQAAVAAGLLRMGRAAAGAVAPRWV